MNYKEIKELIKLVEQSGLAEFKLKDKEFELSIRTEKYSKEKAPQIVSVAPAAVPAPIAAPAPVASNAAATPDIAPAASGASDAGLIEVKSPIVGTLYRSSSPEKPPFVKVGDTIEVGQVVCIVEAMKLFNEIESEVAGKIVKVVADDASPVEYDQVLFLVDPQG